ncbi:MAG: carboxyltransferase domain-containing protein [Devosia sp.]|nr:carboxyltransferase domain-containing protein [Devosia sp.]
MAQTAESAPLPNPLIIPLGDHGLLVRFAIALSDRANLATVAFARRLREQMPEGVTEIDPNLVSVLLKYDPARIAFDQLAGEVRLLIGSPDGRKGARPKRYRIAVIFGGEEGPDLDEVAAALKLAPSAFIAEHNARPLRVLTTGFAPGFVYCGFHPEHLELPRRSSVRPLVPAGTVLFAAGQTAITATSIPTGWYVIGQTDFRNFDAERDPPTQLREGDEVLFEAAKK